MFGSCDLAGDSKIRKNAQYAGDSTNEGNDFGFLHFVLFRWLKRQSGIRLISRNFNYLSSINLPGDRLIDYGSLLEIAIMPPISPSFKVPEKVFTA